MQDARTSSHHGSSDDAEEAVCNLQAVADERLQDGITGCCRYLPPTMPQSG